VPVTRNGLVAAVAAYVVLSGVAIVVGFLIVDHLGALRDLDTRIAHWFGARRTDTWNDVTWVGSGIADTFVKVPAAAVLVAFFFWRWRRWHEAALLAGALALEAAVFVTASLVVGRGRPPIPQLDTIPLTSSYPSGHTGAAVAFYGAIAIVVCWHTRRVAARYVALTVAITLVACVGASRMYRGMHYLSDVVVGILVGGASLLVLFLVVERPPSDPARDRR
jgi:undecaprenyl-diphosphatase